MPRAELRYLGSTDVLDATLEEYQPEDPENFRISVDAYIGEQDNAGQSLPGEEIFEFIVCSPRFIAAEVERAGFLLAPRYLVVARYEYAAIWRAISELCHQVEAPRWESIARRLAYFGLWEFQDYYEPPQSDAGT